MSQFIIRKKNNNNNDKEKHIIVLKNINITNLDKEYVMKEIKENTTKKFIKNSTNVSSISTEEIINNLEKEKNKQPILEISFLKNFTGHPIGFTSDGIGYLHHQQQILVFVGIVFLSSFRGREV